MISKLLKTSLVILSKGKKALIKKKIEDFGENLRKDVHFSTTSVSSIMSADIKISCEISIDIQFSWLQTKT